MYLHIFLRTYIYVLLLKYFNFRGLEEKGDPKFKTVAKYFMEFNPI